MNLISKTLLLGFISKILAAEFSVISFEGDCQLNIGGNTYPMERQFPDIPLYKANVNVPLETKYNYICGGNQDVERTLYNEKTYNELFGRPITLYDMPELHYPDGPWTRTIGRTELFDPTYVPTVIIDADKQFFISGEGSSKLNKVTFILKENVFSFNNVGTSGKNGDENKFQFNTNLPGDGIYHRNILKFRPSSYDPVFFRQILYGDIAHAIGNPAHESVSVRVYLSDGTGIGLYVLQEDCTSESFVRTAFYGNPDGSIKEYTPNVIYDCTTGADFTDRDGNYLGSFKNNTYDVKGELLEMTKKLEVLDVNDESQVNDFSDNDLELNTLLKALALEYLAGHWDSYWGLTTNFVVYHPTIDTGRYRFFFIDQDFDQTWGVGMGPGYDPLNYPTKTYNTMVGINNWKSISQNGDDVDTRVLVNILIGCNGMNDCITKRMFETHLQNIVKYIFNPISLGIKIEGYKERLMDEMRWDLGLTRLHIAEKPQYTFTMEDFENGIYTGNYPSSKFYYGVLDWTEIISNTVCNQFSISYDEEPYNPEESDLKSFAFRNINFSSINILMFIGFLLFLF